MTKTEKVTELVNSFIQSGGKDDKSINEALKIAKSFKKWTSKEERDQVVIGAECIDHEDFYKQLGKDCKKERANAISILMTYYGRI